ESVLGNFLTDLMAGGLESWVDSFTSFDSANIDPILDAIDKNSLALFNDVNGMVADVGAIFQAIWEKPELIVTWLDEPITIPFFSAFYEGLLDNDFSILDFIALAAALPYSVVGPTSDNEIEVDNREVLRYMTFSVMVVRTLAEGVSAFFQQPAGIDVTSKLAAAADYLGIGTNVAIGALVLAFTTAYGDDHWYEPAIVDLCIAAISVITLLRETRVKTWEGRTTVDDVIGMVSGLVAFIVGVIRSGFDGESFGYLLIEIASDSVDLAVDKKKIQLTTPFRRGCYVAFKGALSASLATLFLIDTRPSLEATI